MTKSPEALKTIGEAAAFLNLSPHVLRFWESKFNQIRPLKRTGARRYYRPKDVLLLAAIRDCLRDQGYTIRGVQLILKRDGVEGLIATTQSGSHADRAAAEHDSPACLAISDDPKDIGAKTSESSDHRDDGRSLRAKKGDPRDAERSGAALQSVVDDLRSLHTRLFFDKTD